MSPDIKQIEYKPKTWESFISLEIDQETQKWLLENPELVKSISPVFEAVWEMQDKINGSLKKSD